MGLGENPKTFLLKALFCQRTPSWLKVGGRVAPGIDSGMLVHAARILDNLGDKRMVEKCNKLKANFSSNHASL